MCRRSCDHCAGNKARQAGAQGTKYTARDQCGISMCEKSKLRLALAKSEAVFFYRKETWSGYFSYAK